MSSDYGPRWKELGLDLDAHDALLGVLGPLDEQTFTRQPDRPAGVQYFDFVMSEVEAGLVEKWLEKEGLPPLQLDTDYREDDVGQIQTRVEPFVEYLRA